MAGNVPSGVRLKGVFFFVPFLSSLKDKTGRKSFGRQTKSSDGGN